MHGSLTHTNTHLSSTPYIVSSSNISKVRRCLQTAVGRRMISRHLDHMISRSKRQQQRATFWEERETGGGGGQGGKAKSSEDLSYERPVKPGRIFEIASQVVEGSRSMAGETNQGGFGVFSKVRCRSYPLPCCARPWARPISPAICLRGCAERHPERLCCKANLFSSKWPWPPPIRPCFHPLGDQAGDSLMSRHFMWLY